MVGQYISGNSVEQHGTLRRPNYRNQQVGFQPADLYGRSNLTRLQILYWVGQSLRRDTPIFNTIYTYTGEGGVERERFERRLRDVLESDALRMVIEEKEGVPQQRGYRVVRRG